MGFFDPDPYGGTAPWADAAMMLGAGLMAGGAPGGGGLAGLGPAFAGIAQSGRTRAANRRAAKADERAEKMLALQTDKFESEQARQLRSDQQNWLMKRDVLGLPEDMLGPMPGSLESTQATGQTVPIPEAGPVRQAGGLMYETPEASGLAVQTPEGGFMAEMDPMRAGGGALGPNRQKMALAAAAESPMEAYKILYGDRAARQLAADEVARRNLDPTKQWQVDPKGMVREIGGSGVTVNVEGDKPPAIVTETQKALGKADAQTITDAFAEVNKLRGLRLEFDALEDAMDQFPTGAFGDARLSLGRIANFLGVDNADELAAGELIQSIQSRLAPQMRATGSGSSSDRDVQMFLDSLPNLSRTKAGNQMIINNFRRVLARKEAEANYMRRYVEENGSLSGFSPTEMDKELDPIFNEEERKEIERIEQNPRLMVIPDMTMQQIMDLDADDLTDEEATAAWARYESLLQAQGGG